MAYSFFIFIIVAAASILVSPWSCRLYACVQFIARGVNKIFIISEAKPIELFIELRRRLWLGTSFWSSFDDWTSLFNFERCWVPTIILLSLSWITTPRLEVLQFGMASVYVAVLASFTCTWLCHARFGSSGVAAPALTLWCCPDGASSSLAGFSCSCTSVFKSRGSVRRAWTLVWTFKLSSRNLLAQFALIHLGRDARSSFGTFLCRWTVLHRFFATFPFA